MHVSTSETRRRTLTLEDATVELLDAAIADQEHLSVLLDVVASPGWEGFPEALAPLRDSLTRPSGTGSWGPLLFVLDNPRTLVGLGGFYGPPSTEGVVEIGYAIAPAFQNQCWATEAVRLMIGAATARPEVVAVDATTLAEENASTAVLGKHGFVRIGERNDPEDGPVWQWRRARAASDSPIR